MDINSRAAASSKGIAGTVPLSEAIPALTELERNGTAKRGKLIIVPG